MYAHHSVVASRYTGVTQYDDGTSFEFVACERPHLIMDKDGVTPVALTNGVKPGWGVMQDQSFTLLRPIKTPAPVKDS